MSSRFVSGGTLPGDNNDEAIDLPAPPPQPTKSTSSEWEAAQKHLEAQRQQREAARRAAVEKDGGEKSLYDILQANKAAKQTAFEEANKLSNQFRALDDDEVDFLEGVLERERREKERVERETEEGLRRFQEARKRQVGAEVEGGVSAGLGDGGLDVEAGALATEWKSTAAGGRKRKREKESLIKGLKRRVSAGVHEESGGKSGDAAVKANDKISPGTESGAKKAEVKQEPSTDIETRPKAVPQGVAAKLTGGLVEYGSDDDDDD
jgi:hypothetical protein